MFHFRMILSNIQNFFSFKCGDFYTSILSKFRTFCWIHIRKIVTIIYKLLITNKKLIYKISYNFLNLLNQTQ